jgi:hypothetical protein
MPREPGSCTGTPCVAMRCDGGPPNLKGWRIGVPPSGPVVRKGGLCPMTPDDREEIVIAGAGVLGAHPPPVRLGEQKRRLGAGRYMPLLKIGEVHATSSYTFPSIHAVA